VGQKSIVKVLNQKVTKPPKCFSSFLFFFFSSDGLVQSCMTLSQWFHTNSKQQHFTLSSAPAHCFFHSFEVSQGTIPLTRQFKLVTEEL